MERKNDRILKAKEGPKGKKGRNKSKQKQKGKGRRKG